MPSKSIGERPMTDAERQADTVLCAQPATRQFAQAARPIVAAGHGAGMMPSQNWRNCRISMPSGWKRCRTI